MIRFAICDDDKDFCQYEERYITQIMQERFPQISMAIDRYYDGDSILDDYPAQRHEVVFLDIELGDKNGFDIAGALNKINSHVNIVFITTHNNLIYDSFEYRPVGFVEKMHFDREFDRVINRVIRNMVMQHKIIELGRDKNKVQFLNTEIYMVEAFRHDIVVKCENGDITIKDSFGNNADLLKANGFLLVSRGVMVNKRFIRMMDAKQLQLYDGTVVTIGRSRYKEVRYEYEQEKINQLKGRG